MCNEGNANYHTSNSNYWNGEARDYSTEIKENEVPSCVGCMSRSRRPHKFSFLFLSHLIKYNMKWVGYDVYFIYDTVGTSNERMEWLISRNKLEVAGRKLQFTSRSPYFPAGTEKNV